jgi:hypothetical protein
MMQNFIDWSEEFEKTPYADDDWLDLIDSFAIEMIVIEVEHGRATISKGAVLPAIKIPKDLQNWVSMNDSSWVYLPEYSNRILTKGDFVKLCEGDVEHAYMLFCMCEWQHPETIITESRGLKNLFTEEEV